MRDFCTKPLWDQWPLAPNTLDQIHINEMPPGVSIEECLPEPGEILDWIEEDE
jgi:hypothetical protein